MNKRMFVLVLIGSVILRIAVICLLGDKVEILPGIYDQVSYHTLATRLLNGHGFTFEREWWPLTAAGEPTAHWSYLYTLYLVVVYGLVGIHPFVARLVQAIAVGILMPWLAYRLGKKVFPETNIRLGKWHFDVGIISAAWVGFYGYFIYYAGALMTESFYITAILWTLDCSLRIAYSDNTEGGQSKWQWLELGLAIGVSALLRQVFLLVIPFILVWIVWIKMRMLGSDWKQVVGKSVLGIVLVGIVVIAIIAPFTVINYLQFNRFVLLNTNAGYAFFWANHPIHEDRFVALFTPEMPSYQELIPEELKGLDEASLEKELMQRGIKFVLDDPWRYIKLSISRIADHFIFWPLPESSLISNITRVGSFGLALPFMLLGGAIWITEQYRQSRNIGVVCLQPGGLLLISACLYVAIHLLSWAGIRYRLPTDAIGLIFAARGGIWLVDGVRRRIIKPND